MGLCHLRNQRFPVADLLFPEAWQWGQPRRKVTAKPHGLRAAEMAGLKARAIRLLYSTKQL